MTLRPSEKYPPFAANEKGEIVNLKTGNLRKQTVNKKNGYAYIGTRQGLLLSHKLLLMLSFQTLRTKNRLTTKTVSRQITVPVILSG